MEAMLGVVQMHRDAGSVRVTDKGTELLAAARKLLDAGEEFLEIAVRHDLIEDRLRSGVTEIAACTWLHDYLRAFKAMYPAVRVELDVNLLVELEKDLVAGQLDLALQKGPFMREMAGTSPLGSYPHTWVAAPALGTFSGFKSLFDGPVISHGRNTRASAALAEHALNLGSAVNQIVQSSSLSSCVAMAVDGMGPALLKREIVGDDITAGRLVEVDCG